MHVCAALTLDGSNLKAHHRHTNALLQLSWLLEAAAEAAQAGVARLTGDAAAAQEVAELGKRIQAALDARADAAVRSKPKDGKSPDALASASHTSATPSATSSGSGSYAASGQSASQKQRQRQRKRGGATSQTSDNSMHLAYRYPPQVDVKQAQRLLQTAYENRRGLPVRTEFMLNWSAERILESEPHQLMKRLGGNDKESLEWYFTAQMGLPAIGAAPLRWVGYDASAYAVAKALVVEQMMLDGSPTDAVLQVCYSSAWKASTRTTFRTALSSFTNQASTSKSRGSKGQAGRVPPQSRRMWMESVNAGYIGSVANFKRHSYRLHS
eukprot:gene12564-15787_t